MKFEEKSQTNSTFASWITKLMTRYLEKITTAGIKRALNLLKGLAINRWPEDLELLISRWSSESHTFKATWDEFCPTLEDVIVLTSLPVLGESRPIKMSEDVNRVSLDAEGEKKLELLNRALIDSKYKGKSTCTTWAIFNKRTGGKEWGRAWGHARLLAVLVRSHSGPKDGLNPYSFPLAIRLGRGEKLVLAPIFLGSLFRRLEESAENLSKSMGCS